MMMTVDAGKPDITIAVPDVVAIAVGAALCGCGGGGLQ